MKFFKLLVFLFLICGFANANIGPQGFGQFANYYFIETGTFHGAGLMKAIESGAFIEYRSIEFDQGLFNAAVNRFSHLNKVSIFNGDSSRSLWNMIKDINKPATFWLDAHVYPVRQDGGKNCPVIEELEQISWHPIKTHTILIDDMHCADTEAFDWLSKEDLIAKILQINPKYKIFYVPGGDAGEYPQNIMVAVVQ
jgi:hypothetical protein